MLVAGCVVVLHMDLYLERGIWQVDMECGDIIYCRANVWGLMGWWYVRG